jgi:hypothetical protein
MLMVIGANGFIEAFWWETKMEASLVVGEILLALLMSQVMKAVSP